MAKKKPQIDRASTEEILRLGINTDFWEIISAELEERIIVLSEKLLNEDLSKLPAEQYKFEREVTLVKIELLKKLQRLPGELILNSSSTVEDIEESEDPYETAAEISSTY